MSGKVLRNPTAEEIEKLKNSNVEPIQIAKPVETDNSSEWRDINGARVKKKKSRFEPEPVPFKLISRGVTLGEDSSLSNDDEIYVRRLGTDEEAIIAKIKDITSFNEAANKIFSNCILSDVNIKDLALIDKMHLFAFVNAISFNENISLLDVTKQTCDVCNKSLDVKVTASILKDMEVVYVPKTISSPFKFVINSFPGYKIEMNLTYPTIKNEDLFFQDSVDSIASLKSLIVNWKGTDDKGNEIVEEELEDIIRWMNAEDKETFANKISEFSGYGDTFYFNKFSCSKKAACGMKGKKIELSIVDLMLAIVNAIFVKK